MRRGAARAPTRSNTARSSVFTAFSLRTTGTVRWASRIRTTIVALLSQGC
ncbi:hypothetical protein SAMN02745121_01420 [Nannocystis exedens]|uniref:Uncharacterized protein n=1 Tax=Nannocystis exedens TaxID=54 RepID=A0A1I1UZD8_9BACT|nr:hypothetical protein NAEX_05290 [Nannocystis exedens]SFD75999.1 hypothetical protein SAMN02745121_01420 [Nannocystis exedens]